MEGKHLFRVREDRVDASFAGQGSSRVKEVGVGVCKNTKVMAIVN